MADYREKLLAVARARETAQGCSPHVIVPASSAQEGVLVEEDVNTVGSGDSLVYVPANRQVRRPLLLAVAHLKSDC